MICINIGRHGPNFSTIEKKKKKKKRNTTRFAYSYKKEKITFGSIISSQQPKGKEIDSEEKKKKKAVSGRHGLCKLAPHGVWKGPNQVSTVTGGRVPG